MKDLTGTRLGQYEIVERLGGGGMAVVYRAVQQPLGREIALKALSSELFQDEGFVKRFETEAKTLAKLDHPNILPIYDFEVMDGNTFLTMPLIRGGTLRDVLNRGPLDPLTAWRYLREIGDGLQHANDAGIVHRDLKPTNVLIHADGRAMLADFGLARGAGQPTHLTTIGLAIGTPGYMAPEQVMGHDVDKRADIYAMGALTFEMLTAGFHSWVRTAWRSRTRPSTPRSPLRSSSTPTCRTSWTSCSRGCSRKILHSGPKPFASCLRRWRGCRSDGPRRRAWSRRRLSQPFLQAVSPCCRGRPRRQMVPTPLRCAPSLRLRRCRYSTVHHCRHRLRRAHPRSGPWS